MSERSHAPRLLAEIAHLVSEVQRLQQSGDGKGAATVRRELERLRWQLAGVVSHGALHTDRTAA